MSLDINSPARADVLYLDNAETIDAGAGIDVRLLDSNNGGTNDADQTATATHTQDDAERTFDPDTGGVTNTNNAGTTLFKMGWATRLVDVTPPDDTNCNAQLTAQTLVVNIEVAVDWASTIADPIGVSIIPTWRASLWRYNPSTDAGTLIAAGSSSAQTWDAVGLGVVAAEGEFVVVPISIVVPDNLTDPGLAGVELSNGEVLLLQVGLNTGTLSNPASGTTTYTFRLRVDSVNTNIDFAAGQGIRQLCRRIETPIGKGSAVAPVRALKMTDSLVGKGDSSTSSKAVVASRTFALVGKGVATRQFLVARPFTLAGKGVVPAAVRAVGMTRTAVMVGTVPAIVRALALSRTAVGKGSVPVSTKALVITLPTVVGKGVPTFTKFTTVYRTFALVGKGDLSGSRIEMPIDEVPSLEGGVTIKKIITVFDD